MRQHIDLSFRESFAERANDDGVGTNITDVKYRGGGPKESVPEATGGRRTFLSDRLRAEPTQPSTGRPRAMRRLGVGEPRAPEGTADASRQLVGSGRCLWRARCGRWSDTCSDEQKGSGPAHEFTHGHSFGGVAAWRAEMYPDAPIDLAVAMTFIGCEFVS